MISLPPGTEMFQFPGLAPCLRRVTGLATGRVSPFGNPGITASVQLPQAYRSLARPSSPLDAKASTVCLIAFDLMFSCKSSGSCDRTGRPVLIPHTRPGREARTHHPSVDCQRAWRIPRDPPRRSNASQNARECGRLLRTFERGATLNGYSPALLVAPERR